MQQLVYQPLLPTGNKYLQQRWDKASYDMHRRKVVTVKPTINTTPPKTYEHLSLKSKTQKLEADRMSKIQMENSMLLDKISYIMRTTGRIDNKNDYEHKSLSKGRRQQEFQRITRENQLILQRLTQCQPHYRAKDWHYDWLKTLKLMESIAIFPRKGPLSSGPSQNGGLQSDTEPSQSSGDRDILEEGRCEAPGASLHCHSHTGTECEETNGSSEVQEQEKTDNQQNAAHAPDKSRLPVTPDLTRAPHTPPPTLHSSEKGYSEGLSGTPDISGSESSGEDLRRQKTD